MWGRTSAEPVVGPLPAADKLVGHLASGTVAKAEGAIQSPERFGER